MPVKIGETRRASTLKDNLLLESIDEALTDLVGRRAKEAVFDCLERNRSISRDEVPKRLEDLCSLLQDTFGRGSMIIGKVIAKRFYAKLRCEFVEIDGFGLRDYVKRTRMMLASAQ